MAWNLRRVSAQATAWHIQRSGTCQSAWLWLSQYGPTAVVPVNWGHTWTMWRQYTTDGAQKGPGPYQVAGIGRCDREKFNGTAAELATFWRRGAPTNIT